MVELLINENDIIEQSKNEVRTIADNFTKSKAYYNALAANVVMDYLRKEGLINSELVNMHSSARFLADFDVADIQLPNLHIDVRGVFDENEIFIPKKHFVNKILPDIYLVAKFNEDFSAVSLLGFVEPAKINKKNQNDEYYFVNKAVLSPVSELAGLIASKPSKSPYILSDETEASLEKLIMLYMDHDIDDLKLEKLVDYLKNSAVAREKLVEFENFERLSYLALKEFKDLDVENNDFTKYIKTIVSADEFSQFDAADELSTLFDEPAENHSSLFVDDEESVITEQEEVQPEELSVEEVEIVENIEDETIELDVEEPEMVTEEVAEQEEIIQPEELIEEAEDDDVVETPLVDEFEAFDAVDEFDVPQELDLADAIAEQSEETAVESENVVEEAGVENIIDDEPVSLEVTTDEETEPVVESLVEPLTGEDLELHVEGFENIGEDLDLSEDIELEPVDIEAGDLTADVEDEKLEEATEVNVADELALDEVELSGETVIGLTEEVMDINNQEDVVPEISMDMLGDIEFLDELEPEERSETVQEVVDNVATVTDEEVDNAIAQSTQAEDDNKISEIDLDNFSETQESSDADNLNLDELLSMENDLSASDEESDTEPKFVLDDEEDEDESAATAEEDSPISEDASELDFMFNDSEEVSEEESEEESELPDDLLASAEGENMPEGDEGTDFAFAVDSKTPAQKNLLVPVAALVAAVGLVGAGAWYFLSNGKSSSNDFQIPETTNTGIEDLNINDVVGQDVVNSVENNVQPKEDAANKPQQTTPQSPAPAVADIKLPAQPEAKEAEVKPEPLTIQKIKRDFSQPNTYLSVSKIVWDVPEYLTYNEDFSGYLQTLGSTLKLNLSSDLLLISENPMFDKVRVKIQLKESGKKYSAEIEDGCGVQSLDDLVLQSVKNTLNLLKPPVNSLETADEDLYITIYL